MTQKRVRSNSDRSCRICPLGEPAANSPLSPARWLQKAESGLGSDYNSFSFKQLRPIQALGQE